MNLSWLRERARGYAYVGSSDHSQSAHYANGLSPERLGLQREEIEEARIDIAISDEPEATFNTLGEFLVNPADSISDRGLRFIKAQVSLGVSPASVYDQLALHQPKLRAAIVRILSSKKVEELDNPEDREFIKDEIRFAVNAMLIRGEVLRVYFPDFIIQ